MKSIEENISWKKSNIQMFWGEIAPYDHLVQVYENDNVFLNTLEGFAGDGFIKGESIIIIATPDHLDSLNKRLSCHGFDLEALKEKDQYITLDAQDCATDLLVNGWPDEARFTHFVNTLMERANKHGSKVRVFGEIVAVLWEQGYHGATVQLESMWHRIQNDKRFCLYCAYPKSGFIHDVCSSIGTICKTHSMIINGYGHPSTEISYMASI